MPMGLNNRIKSQNITAGVTGKWGMCCYVQLSTLFINAFVSVSTTKRPATLSCWKNSPMQAGGTPEMETRRLANLGG